MLARKEGCQASWLYLFSPYFKLVLIVWSCDEIVRYYRSGIFAGGRCKLNLCVCCKETLSGIVFFACCGQYVVRCLRLLVFCLGWQCVLLESASHVINVLIISNPVCIVSRMDKCTYIAWKYLLSHQQRRRKKYISPCLYGRPRRYRIEIAIAFVLTTVCLPEKRCIECCAKNQS